MTEPNSERVSATHWPIVLSDWKRSNANVTIHLRGGGSVGPGKVLDTGKRDWPARLEGYPGGRQTIWNVDLSEVAAITAEAS